MMKYANKTQNDFVEKYRLDTWAFVVFMLAMGVFAHL